MRIIPEDRAKVKPNDEFVRLTVLGRPFRLPRRVGVVCECTCGAIVVAIQDELLRGHTQSCGCLAKTQRLTHGFARKKKSRLYRCWCDMIARTEKATHASYPDYGGRGIRVCEEWRDFVAFKDWALANGYSERLTIERRNNDLGYGPDNCRWATRAEQNRNSRSNVILEIYGEKKLLSLWAADPRCVVEERVLRWRIDAGWTPERAITMKKKARHTRDRLATRAAF